MRKIPGTYYSLSSQLPVCRLVQVTRFIDKCRTFPALFLGRWCQLHWRKNSMVLRTMPSTVVLPIIWLLVPLCAQEAPDWRDPSSHRVQFVTVDDSVRL